MDALVAPESPTAPFPDSRLPVAAEAHAIYKRLQSDDISAAQNRALIQDMFDGAPPYSADQLRKLGRADACNLNFGDAQAIRDTALSGYYDLTNSVDTIINALVRQGDPTLRGEWGRIISEEFHGFFRRWPKGEYNMMRLADRYVCQGVAIGYYDDPTYWGWEPSALGDFRIPRNTAATEDAIEIATCTRYMPVHTMAQMIADPEAAAKRGWNVDVVKAAIYRACHENKQPQAWQQVEDFQRQIKENGLMWSHARASSVHLVYYWVQELPKDKKPGKVTMAIGLEDGSNEDFLFKKKDYFDSIQQCFTLFCYGIGNGTYHTIRGLGHKIFPHIQILNRTLCDAVDMMRLTSAVMVQPETTEDLQKTALTYIGPLAAMAPGFKIVERSFPQPGHSLLPIVHEMDVRMQNNTGSYRTRATTPEGQARTATEVRAQLQQEAILSQDAMNLFYVPLTRLLREMFRRVNRKGWTEKERGGREALEFRRRVLERGVPEEILDSIDPADIEVQRAVGYGSPQMRVLALDEMLQIAGALDEVGRNALMRDRIAARVGFTQVDRYLPRTQLAGSGARPTIDDEFAVLENELLKNGIRPQVISTQAHAVHAKLHAQAAMPFLKVAEEQAHQIDPLRLAEALEGFGTHILEHCQQFAGDPMRKEEFAQLKPVGQNCLQTAEGIFRVLQQRHQQMQQQQVAAMQEQAQAPQDGGSAPGGIDMTQHINTSLEMAAKIQEHAALAKIRAQEHEQRLQERAAESRQKMAIRDAAAAQELALKRAKI